LKVAIAFLVLTFAGCASAPMAMATDARGPNGERLPDVCYQSSEVISSEVMEGRLRDPVYRGMV
jgi:hypothetical protein